MPTLPASLAAPRLPHAPQVRIPLSGRKYRVFLGPHSGMYAESVAKAWETQQRAEERESELATATEEAENGGSEAPAKKKRPRKMCLACDFGRKRKCSCGRRSRLW